MLYIIPTMTDERFRVRDKDWTIYGENLTAAAAHKLKEYQAAVKKVRTVRIESMSVPMPGDPEHAEMHELEGEIQGLQLQIGDAELHEVPSDGVIALIPAGHELQVNGIPCPVPSGVKKGDLVQANPLDPIIAAAQAAAREAAKQRIPPQHTYRDKTVRKPQPRKGPTPKDKTVAKGMVVRLGAPAAAPPPKRMSPLKAAMMQDGDEMPDNAIGEEDILDVASDLGGGASDADVEHARKTHGAG